MSSLKLFSLLLLSGLAYAQQTHELQCTSTFAEHEKMAFIQDWAKFVAQKSFNLSHKHLENQLKQLQFCYSSSGWNQFNRALHQSGNLNLISQHQLQANTQVMGPVEVRYHPKYTSWTAIVPMRVVYQNQQQKISQELNVHLTINELKDKHLAVIQIVGKPIEK